MLRIDKFKINGKIIDWNEELIKIASLNLRMALGKVSSDRDRLVSLARDTLELVG